MRSRLGVIGAAVFAVFLALAIWTAATKAPWCDEGWFASPARNLAFKGFMGTTVLDPASGTPHLNIRTRLDGIDRYTYWVMPLYPVTEAAWYRVVGFGLMRMRALSIVLAVLALACWLIVFTELSGSRSVALLAVALLAVDYHFIWAATDGRMDMLCSALGVAGLAAYLRLRQRNLAWALLAANALIAASGLTHPNGVLYLVALVCIVMIYDRSRFDWRHLAIAAVPYLVGLAVWAPYILKAPDLFKIQLLGNAAGRQSAFTAPWLTLQREFIRYRDGFGFAPWSKGLAHLSVVELLAFLVGIAVCATYAPLQRRNPGSRRLITIIGALCLFLWLFEGLKAVEYLIHVVPWFSAALAIAMADYWTGRRGPRLVPVAVLALVFFLDLVRVAVPAMRDKYHKQFLPAARYLERHTSPSDLIMGTAELGFGIGFDRNLIDDIMLGTTTGKSARFIVMDRRYQDYVQSIRITAPAAYERAARQLDEKYEKVYDEATFQIYRRRL
jgi:4-amino-4-deoxy-L-arabinose transferase-like glycosyltransferase